MRKLRRVLGKVWSDQSGQGLIEYGLILALIAVVVIGVLVTIGTGLLDKFTTINDKVNDTTP